MNRVMVSRLLLSTGVGFTAIPGWRDVVLLPPAERWRAFGGGAAIIVPLGAVNSGHGRPAAVNEFPI